MNRLRLAFEKFKHRQKLSVAIPINHEAYKKLLEYRENSDMDLGDTILRIIRMAETRIVEVEQTSDQSPRPAVLSPDYGDEVEK